MHDNPRPHTPYACGRQIKFFPSEPLTRDQHAVPSDELARHDKMAHDVLELIMKPEQDAVLWSRLMTFEAFHALFLERDDSKLRGLRKGFREGFNYLFKQFQEIQDASYDEAKHRQHLLILSNCLSLLPYADIKPGQIYKIPEWDEEAKQWNLVDFTVSAIELTPTYGLERVVIGDSGRVFAYGLKPRLKPHQSFQSKPQPHLLFMGATYPAGQGFFPQFMAMLEMFSTPGLRFYRQGKEKITRWIEVATKEAGTKARVHGMSLGGATAFFAALDPDNAPKISRLDAYNPPGLCEVPYLTDYQKQWDALPQKPEVFVQMQVDDPISSRFGFWLLGWNILKVTPLKTEATKHNGLVHALSHTLCKETTFEILTKEEIALENKQRWWFNFAVKLILGSFAFLLAVPCYYLIHPMISALLKHKTEASLLIGTTLIFMMLPGLVSGWTGILILMPICLYLGYKMLDPLSRLVHEQPYKAPKCHEQNHDELSEEIGELRDEVDALRDELAALKMKI